PRSPGAAPPQRMHAGRLPSPRGPWRPQDLTAGARQWPAEPEEPRRWAAPGAEEEQPCAVPDVPKRAPRARPRPGGWAPPAWMALEAATEDALEHGSDARLLLPFVCWPEWPSARRLASRHERDRFWARCLEGREKPRNSHGCVIHAQIAREPFPPRNPQA